MITVKNIALNFGARKLFQDVNIKFTEGNCYGVIGANGAGKSTFLKILSGEQEPSAGQVEFSKGQNFAVLKQDHFRYQDETVIQTVIMGHDRLVSVMQEKEAIYANPNFSEEDGNRAAELETEFASLGGWEAETDAATLLKGLGIGEKLLQVQMKELKDSDKLKVLLAQTLFARPDHLLLDEPTNHLDDKSIRWLEDYLLNFPNTVIVISHDRHFLNKICTHMVDIDYGKAQLYVGNYDFWLQSSELARELRSNENKKKEEKAKELESFIRRFSANASKSSQATSRRKQLEKLTLEELPISTRKSPNILFQQKREAGDILLEVENISKALEGQTILKNVTFTIRKGDKAIFVGDDEIAKTLLFRILTGEVEPDSGTFRWGVTTTRGYLPKDNNVYFENKDLNLIDWLREYSEDKSENFIRSFLGRMLFSGEETLKKSSVLSGGEKVRCMLAKMMLLGPNVLLLDGPTNHLDLETITALNDSVIAFPGTVLFTTHDLHFAQTVSNRLFEIKDTQVIDHQKSYTEFYEQNKN
ncbi:MAG: ATP-binding cassette domain-containing protein [Myxococcales bacterium]|nr:MAG: ATP-binding cassette domain-containing protein [Myxococcales bacterium]